MLNNINLELLIKNTLDSDWTLKESNLLFDAIKKIDEGVSSEEILVQGKLLKQLSDGNDMVVRTLIDRYGSIFRDAINFFRKKYNKIPSMHDLIKFSNARSGTDIVDVAKVLRKELTQSGIDFYK